MFVLASFVLIVFSLASYFVSGSVILDGFEAIEDEQAVTDSERALNALDVVLGFLDRLLVDWAYWDDAYRFVQDSNEEFIRSNLTVETFLKQGIAFVIFLDEGGGLVWGMGVDAVEKEFVPLTRGMREAASGTSPLLLDDARKDSLRGVLLLDETPYLVASRRVRDSNAAAVPRGVCIMGRQLDASMVEDLERSARLNLDIRVLSQEERASAPAARGPLLDKEPASIAALSIIRDLSGEPALAVTVHDNRDVMALGLATSRQNFLGMLATGIGVGAVFVVILELRILRRLKRISTQADAISRSVAGPRRISIRGDDEISGLADNINRMLDKIETDETFLRRTLDSLQAGVVLMTPGDSRIVDINAFALKLVDRPREEVVGELMEGLLHPKEPDLGGQQRRIVECAMDKLLTRASSPRSIIKSVNKVSRDGKDLLLETFIDISDLEAAQQALQVSEEKYRAVFMNTGTASILIAPDTTIVLANTEFGNLVGLTRSEIENVSSFLDFLPEDQAQRLMQYHRNRRVDPSFAPREYDSLLVGEGGVLRDVHMTVAVVPGTDFSIASVMDITDRIRVEKELAHQAFHDSLTGLPNRLLLSDRIQHAIGAANSVGQKVGVLLLDLDRFKQVNDSLGHPFGDKLLGQAAARLTGAMQASATIARLGGDEFVVVIENIRDMYVLAQAAGNILAAFQEPFTVDGHVVHLTVSIGVASFPRDGDTPDALVKNAEIAMHRAKELGKNTYSMFTKELNDQAIAKMALEMELHGALGSDSFFLVYQPKVDAATGRIIGCEALVRWRDASGRLIPPGEFIPLAEEMGLVARLDAWVLEKACREVRQWRDRGATDLTLAVNVSARSFQTGEVAGNIRKVLSDTGFPASHLEIELTETALMTDWKRVVKDISAISGMGVRIALDDFGTGHSSLYYLQKLPIGCLKIDRRFVEGVASEESDTRVLVRTIISLAGSLGIDVVAEGVETHEQLRFLLENRCTVIQGYLFSPPLLPEVLEPMLGRPLPPSGGQAA